MTGHGHARFQDEEVEIVSEIRTVNSRFLKLNVFSDLDAEHSSKLETLIKNQLQRGTVTLRLNVKSSLSNAYELNEAAVRAYWLQLSEIAGSSQPVNIESLLRLPGVVSENSTFDYEALWPKIESVANESLKRLAEMRAKEGASMQQDMLSNCDSIADHLGKIEALAPQIVENYSKRLTDRLNAILEKYDITVQPTDVIREIGIFSERGDISEEIVRLGTHIDHFREIMADKGSNGRKLDFLIQEILRETNTIGSKANDSTVANHVVEIKTAIERMREMVQNIE
jgi:uncharacterized protein (TIGR00255 family)